MKFIFNEYLIKVNELVFFSFIALMVLLLVISTILVIKAVKNGNK